MLDNYAHDACWAYQWVTDLAAFYEVELREMKPGAEEEPLEPDQLDTLQCGLRLMRDVGRALDLGAVSRHATDILLPAEVSPEEVYRSEIRPQLRALAATLLRELEDRQFYFIRPSLRGFYEDWDDEGRIMPPFGQEVADRFPDSTKELVRAGQCLALGQSTACVFHLMRAMEYGVRALAGSLGISHTPSWEGYLRAVHSKLDGLDPKDANARVALRFYQQVYADLVAVKNAWRNTVMHVERDYDEADARVILAASRALMKRLAKGLPPSP